MIAMKEIDEHPIARAMNALEIFSVLAQRFFNGVRGDGQQERENDEERKARLRQSLFDGNRQPAKDEGAEE